MTDDDMVVIQTYLNFEVNFFFFFNCILLTMKVKLFQRTTSRNLIVFLKNDKNVS